VSAGGTDVSVGGSVAVGGEVDVGGGEVDVAGAGVAVGGTAVVADGVVDGPAGAVVADVGAVVRVRVGTSVRVAVGVIPPGIKVELGVEVNGASTTGDVWLNTASGEGVELAAEADIWVSSTIANTVP